MAVRTAEADLVVMLAAKMAEVDLEELGVMVAVGRMAEALEVSMEMVVIRAAVAMRDDNTNNLLLGPSAQRVVSRPIVVVDVIISIALCVSTFTVVWYCEIDGA